MPALGYIPQNNTDFQITQLLRNDPTRPIQYGINCIDYRNNHPSKKQKQIMHDNDSYMRSKTELRKYDPKFKNKKYGKSGAGHQSSFNEVQKTHLWNVRDKAFHGKSFEQVKNEKLHIIDQKEYEDIHNPHVNEQAGYKPTNRIKGKTADKESLINEHINQNGGNKTSNTSKTECIRNTEKYPEVCKRVSEGLCGKCDGSYQKQLCCIFVDSVGYKPLSLNNQRHEAK